MSLTKTWAPHFSRTIRERGRACYESGQVAQRSPGDGELARAVVSADDAGDAIVVVRGNGRKPAIECSCDQFKRGLYCKHLWATLLSLEKEGGPGDGDAAAITSESQGFVPPAPKARKRDRSSRPQRRTEPEWATRLSLLSTGRGDRPTVAAALADPKQIVYVVNPSLSVTHGGLVVDVRWSQPGRVTATSLKPFKFNAQNLGELNDPIDREICGLLVGATWVEDQESGEWEKAQRRRSSFRLPTGTWRSLLKRVTATGRCAVQLRDGKVAPLAWDDDERPWVLWLLGRHIDEGLELTVELRRDAERISVATPTLVLGGGDGIVIQRGKVGLFDDRGALRWVNQFRREGQYGRETRPLIVPHRDVPRFAERLYLLADLPEIDLPEDVALPAQQVAPRPHIELFSPRHDSSGPGSRMLNAQVWFSYGGRRVEADDPGRFIAAHAPHEDDAQHAGAATSATGGAAGDAMDATAHDVAASLEEDADEDASIAVAESPGLIRRDLRFEQEALYSLVSLGFRASQQEEEMLALPPNRMPEAVSGLIGRGWVVRADKQIVRGAAPPKLSIRSGIDWFEVHGGVAFDTADGEQIIPLPQILAAARAGKAMVTLSDGTQGVLPQQWLEQHGLLGAIGQAEEDHLRFKNSQAAMLDVLLDEQSLIDVDEQFAEAREKLRRFDKIEPATSPDTFNGTLRTYQREGLGWLHFLEWFGMGGILADDMGLGKTIQVLALLEEHYGKERGKGSEGQRGKGLEERSDDTLPPPLREGLGEGDAAHPSFRDSESDSDLRQSSIGNRQSSIDSESETDAQSAAPPPPPRSLGGGGGGPGGASVLSRFRKRLRPSPIINRQSSIINRFRKRNGRPERHTLTRS